MPTLTIQLPGQPPVFHVLKDETITIGRMKGNTIVIEDTSISLMHAKITRKDGQFYLKDLNSTNGTIVNGQPIGEVRLRDHDKVRFAEITTEFLMEDIAPAAATLPPPAAVSAAAPLAIMARAGEASPAAVAPAAAKPDAAAPVSASTSQTQATPKLISTASSPATKGKLNGRVLVVAAALALVVLPGIGFMVWRTITSEGSKPELAQQAPRQTKKSPAKEQTAAASPRPAATTPPEPAAPAPASDAASQAGGNLGELIASLKSQDVSERRQAASALHDLGMEAKDATPALKQALKDADSEVQMWAALSLVNTQTYDKEVIPILVRSLKNDNAVLRQVACLSLGLIPYEAGDKAAVVPALTDAAGKDPSDDVRQAAKSALNIIGAEAGTGNRP